MRILHVSWEYPPLVYGGLGRHVHGLATAQANLGHEVTVLSQRPIGAAADERLDGVRVIRVRPPTPEVPMDPDALVQWATDLDNLFVGELSSTLEATRPDVVHGHDWLVGNALAWVHHNTAVPTVATFHATESGRHQGWITSDVSKHIHAVETEFAATSDRIITCSHAMQSDVVDLFHVDPDRVDVIPNGISLADWNATAAEPKQRTPDASGSRFLVVFAGRLEWEKGVHTLIKAVRLVAQERDTKAAGEIKLVVAGTGTCGDALRAEAADLVAAENVEFKGWVPDAELKSLLGNANVVVVPSIYEPFGIAALEAAAAGTPLIVSRVGGLADLVSDEVTGLSFAADNATELAAKLVIVREDPATALLRAQRLQRTLESRFDWVQVARQTVDTYSRAT